MGCNGEEALGAIEHGDSREETSQLHCKEAQGETERRYQLFVLLLILLGRELERQASLDVAFPGPEQSDDNHQMGQERQEPRGHEPGDPSHGLGGPERTPWFLRLEV